MLITTWGIIWPVSVNEFSARIFDWHLLIKWCVEFLTLIVGAKLFNKQINREFAKAAVSSCHPHKQLPLITQTAASHYYNYYYVFAPSLGIFNFILPPISLKQLVLCDSCIQ